MRPRPHDLPAGPGGQCGEYGLEMRHCSFAVTAELACDVHRFRCNVRCRAERLVAIRTGMAPGAERVKGWVRSPKAVCPTLSQPPPMSPPRGTKTLANRLADDPICCDAPARLHLNPEHNVNPEKIGGIGGLRFSGF